MIKNEYSRLPYGTSNFATLRKRHQIYVDKTELVYEIASFPGKYFLSRPRRFGKSLLISTFESLFKYGLRDFKGLAIENLWDDEEKYLVLNLDFSRLKSFAQASVFSSEFDTYLENQFKPLGFTKEPDGLSTALQIERFIQNLPLSSLVVLIDEYDAPLTACINQPIEFTRVRSILSNFYSILKTNDGALRFMFMTGITKFSRTSIFSELNNFEDISFNPTYGTILGYTEEEIKDNFNDYLRKAGLIVNLSENELLDNLRINYDGFCFDEEASTKVYNPWSVLNFLKTPNRGFKNYWFESGGKARILLEYFKTRALPSPMDFSSEKLLTLEELTLSSNLEDLNAYSLLTQAGYFTIKKLADVDTVVLGYPNKEVAQSMAKFYTEVLLQGNNLAKIGINSVPKHFMTETPESIVLLLNRIFLSIDAQKNPIRLESEVQRLVQVFLYGAGLLPRVETVNALGRSDLEVSAGKRLWLFEFKVKRPGENEETLLAEALDQIRKRKYGEQHGVEKLIRIALVFSVEERQFVRWAELPGDPLPN